MLLGLPKKGVKHGMIHEGYNSWILRLMLAVYFDDKVTNNILFELDEE